MRQFIDTIQQSLYDPRFYRELPSKSFGSSMRYFLSLIFVIALVLTILVSILIIPPMNEALSKLPEATLEAYPDGLEIVVDHGKVSTNLPEPIVIPPPVPLREIFRTMEVSQFAVIDTTTPFSIEQFERYDALLWIQSDAIVARDANGKITFESIPDTGERVVLAERDINAFLSDARGYFPLAAPLVAFLIFCVFYIVELVQLAYLLVVGALLILLLGRVMKYRWTYGEAYQIGLHAMTGPLILDALLTFFRMPLMGLPFSFSAIMLALVYANYRADALPPPAPIPEPEPPRHIDFPTLPPPASGGGEEEKPEDTAK